VTKPKSIPVQELQMKTATLNSDEMLKTMLAEAVKH